MPQRLIINLDAEKPDDMLGSPIVRVDMINGYFTGPAQLCSLVTPAGEIPLSQPNPAGDVPRSVVILSDDRGNRIALTARNLLNLTGAIRGRMAHNKEINTAVNPPLAVAADPVAGVLHFAFEAPHHTFDYSREHATNLWRAIKEATYRL